MTTHSPSRRSLLAGALAIPTAFAAGSVFGGTPAAVAGDCTPTPPPPPPADPPADALPLVMPVWTEAVRRSYGVCAHPTFMTKTYQHADVWLPMLKDLGAAYFRGRYTPSSPHTQMVIDFCRANGIGWNMTLIPEDWSLTATELKKRLAHIRDNAADVCFAVEGINEPNHERGAGFVPKDWAQRSVAYQKILWDFVKSTPSMSHVKVVSPSLWIGGGQRVDVDFKALADAGVTRYIDYAGMHSYPGGEKPDNKLDTRLGWVRDYWGDKIPYWGTETGYTNALNATKGFKPVPEVVAACYGPRSILTYFERGAMSTRFELLGDPNEALTDVEAHFGLVHTPSLDPATWRLKQEYAAVSKFQARLADPGVASYDPVEVPLRIEAPADVKTTVVQNSTGGTWVLAYRDVDMYDYDTRTVLDPGTVDVTVTDKRGVRVIPVGPYVKGIWLRNG